MSTAAQRAANRANAQQSTGPKTAEGICRAATNNFRHGLTGTFTLLPWEKQEQFEQLAASLRQEYQAATPTEEILVERLAQHHWLSQRALRLQEVAFLDFPNVDQKQLALYLRYQSTHERAFHRCLIELAKLRAEKRKQEIGFESQRRAKADQLRKLELHQARLRTIHTKADDQELKTHARRAVEAGLQTVPENKNIALHALQTTPTAAPDPQAPELRPGEHDRAA